MIRRGIVEEVEDLEGLRVGDVIGLYDLETKLAPIQVAMKTDENDWTLLSQSIKWSAQTLFATAREERLHIHLMRRA